MMATCIFNQYELSTGIRLVISGLSQSRKATNNNVPENNIPSGTVKWDLFSNNRPNNRIHQATNTSISKPSLQGALPAIYHLNPRRKVNSTSPSPVNTSPIFQEMFTNLYCLNSLMMASTSINAPRIQKNPKSRFPKLSSL